jgi:hypothetical protein
LQVAVESGPGQEFTIPDDGTDTADIPDVVKRIAVEQDQIGGLAAFDRAVRSFESEISCGTNRRRLERGHRRQTAAHERFQLIGETKAGDEPIATCKHANTGALQVRDDATRRLGKREKRRHAVGRYA